MATDLRQIWFLAIRTADSFELNRLLFTTPSPSAGVERLSWTLPADLESQINLVDYEKTLGTSRAEINGLEYAVINWLTDKKSVPRFDVIRTLISVTPSSMLNHHWGDDNTVMHLAALSGDKKLYRMLNDKGADSLQDNRFGISARQLADQCQISLPPSMGSSPIKQKKNAMSSFASLSAASQLEDEEAQMVRRITAEVKPTDRQSVSSSPQRQQLDTTSSSNEPAGLSNVERIKMQLKTKQRKISFGTMAAGKITKGNESPIARLTVKEIKDSISRKANDSSSPVRSQIKFDDIFDIDDKESQAIAEKIMKAKPQQPAKKAEVIANESDLVIPKQSAEPLTVKQPQQADSGAAHPVVDLQGFVPPPLPKDFVADIIASSKQTPAEISNPTVHDEIKSDMKPATSNSTPVTVTACANESIKKSSIVVDYSKLDLNDIKIPKMITVAEIKPTVLLTDELDKPETRPDSPKKNVQFGNSWKGTLEMKGSSSIRVPPKSIRASLNDDTFKAPSKPAPFGKLLIKMNSLQGLAMNLSRMPVNSTLYCVVIAGSHNEPVYTKPIPCCQQIMHTAVPMNEEFGFFIASADELITVELRIRMEIPQKQKFIAKQLMRASSVRNILRGKAMNGRLYKANVVDSAAPPTIREETISRIQIHIGDIMDRCNNNILERCWSWEVQEPIRNRSNSSSERPESRFSGFSSLSRSSSRIKEAGNFLLSKLQSKDPSSMLARGESLYEVMEAGTLGMQLFYVDGLESAEEASKVPLKIQNAYTWLTRKNWVNTDWLSGFLSQQGGDVSSWRRRFFKMVGSQLDAYHEFVTDLQALPLELDADVYPTMNSFRLRFKHDEFIDFYADNEEDFAKWTSTLRHVLRNMPNFEAPNDEDPAETNCGQPTGYHEEAGLAQNVARAIERKPALKQSSIGFPVESRAALLDALKSDGSDSSDSDVDYKVSEGHLRQIENTDRVHKVVMHGIPAFGQTVPRKAPIAQHVGVFGSRH